MFWSKSKNKIKVKSAKKYIFSIKKLTTFGGKKWYYPLVREDSALSVWDVICRVNERVLVTLSLETADIDYAVESEEKAKAYIVEYKEHLRKLIEFDIQQEEVLEYNNLKEAKDENEN